MLKPAELRRANLIGIGAPRTATSSLARMLAATPDVFVPREKELNSFGIVEPFAPARYTLRFAEAQAGHRYLADISPVYISNHHVPERIRSYNPDARIIATLRDPLSRVISQYRHMKNTAGASRGPDLDLDIDTYLRAGLTRIRRRRTPANAWYSAAMNICHSFYGTHLSRYYRFFPRDQILVLIYEDLVEPQQASGQGAWQRQLEQFLGVTVDQRSWENRAGGVEPAISDEVAGEVRKLLAPQVLKAGDLIGRDLGALWGY